MSNFIIAATEAGLCTAIAEGRLPDLKRTRLKRLIVSPIHQILHSSRSPLESNRWSACIKVAQTGPSSKSGSHYISQFISPHCCTLHLGPGLDNKNLSIGGHAALHVLGAPQSLLDCRTSLGNPGQQVPPELLILQQPAPQNTLEREREIYFKSHISLWEHSSHFRLIGRGVPSESVVSQLMYKFLCLASPKENPQVPM